ncbi:MAG: T9SS type A sorting domain-containing protein [Ignavibacteriota bacterium]|nr:T9SS C-terminal target domain-containing protein [Ignavibacteriota bacterium]MCO6448299.1 immune inhibitor A [Ignavibacterium album]QKK00920.1 MAG: T9SS type A sorting domain-containing protein [Ignavibacteriota bacterium]HOJ08109.1 M14 family zinc carboxypeptidase [Ignavibacteriaceae bacterium]
MRTIFTVLFFLLSINIFPQNYQKINISITSPNDFIRLSEAGINLEGSKLSKENKLAVFVSDNELAEINSLGISYEVLIKDWQLYYNSMQTLDEIEKQTFVSDSKKEFNVDGFGFGSMGGYYTYAEIAANLDSMYANYPNLITQKYSIGTSHENRTIWAVKISDNPNISENEPAVGFDALIHAREPQSMATLMYYMWYLLQNYGTNSEVTYLVNNREIYCVPCFNPDGYEYNRINNPGGGGMWRKNRRNNGGGYYGVDLNRNFGYAWGYDDYGSSPDAWEETYRGPFAFSEPEVQAIRDLAILANYKTQFTMHSYGEYILYPWGYVNMETPDSLVYREFAALLTSKSGYEYGSGGQLLGYNSNGSERDWMYGEQTLKGKTYGYTIEIGDDFWPYQYQIFPIAQQNLSTMLYQTHLAGAYVQMIDPGYSEPFIDPGDNISMNSIFKNIGLATAYNLDLQLTSLSPYITITTGTAQFDSIVTRSTAALTIPLEFSVSPSAPTDVTAKLLLTSSFSGNVVKKDTLSFVLGTQMFVFADSTNDPLVLWDVTSTPASSPKWEATTLSYHSSPTSFTDSKNGNYISNATVTMTLKNAIDLSAYSNPRLKFWTKYVTEAGYDYCQVKASTNNGSTWVPLHGKYTQLGSGSLPSGQPLYTGTQSTWVEEEMNLAPYASSQFKLRFELKSDYAINKDGWYVDDIGIFYFGIIPVELTSFTAQVIDSKVSLKWQTATELNNSGFEIQKKKSGDKNQNIEWAKIGFVNGKGTTASANNYFFIDDELTNGKTYYRLKQLDFDGTFSYSHEVEVDYKAPVSYSLEQNYPNPFNPETDISFTLAKSDNVTLKIYNILGSEVVTLVNEFMEAGKHTIKFNAADLTSGVYLYTIKSGSFTATRKMILMK